MTESNNVETTNHEFKVLYMLGMIFVMCGHFGTDILTVGGIFQYDTFHIPMFIFASGYFYKSKYASNIRMVGNYCKKKIIHLLIPYYVWNLIYYILAFLIQKKTVFRIVDTQRLTLSNWLFVPFQLADGAVYNVAAWFLMALFLCQIFNNLIRYFLQKIKVVNTDILMLLISLMGAVLSIELAENGWNVEWRLGGCRTLYLLFYYNLGVVYKRYLEKVGEKINDIVAIVCCICANLTLISMYGDNVPICYNMTFDAGINPFYYMARAIIGILFWLRVVKIITGGLGLNKIGIYYANHTFSLMMHQGLFEILINGVIIKILHKENLLGAYHTQIWFNSLDGMQKAWLPILVSASILLCIKIYDYLIERLKGLMEK